MTAEVLDRFARGDLDDARLFEVLSHLESCEECARAGQHRMASDLAALHAEWTSEPVAPRRSTRVWTLAAAAAIAIVALALLLVPKERPSPHTPGRTIVIPPVKPIPSAPSTTDAAPESQYADPRWQRLVTRALESGRLSFPRELAELSAPADTVRGGTGPDERIAPVGVVIDEVRPAFLWPAREGGTYTVFVFDDEREVIQSPALKQPFWTADRDLPRGRTLTWQVEVTGAGTFETIPSPPTPPAMFRITSESDHRDLTLARERHGDDNLLLAVLYARSGMRAEAMEALRRAAALNETTKRILDRETSTAR